MHQRETDAGVDAVDVVEIGARQHKVLGVVDRHQVVHVRRHDGRDGDRRAERRATADQGAGTVLLVGFGVLESALADEHRVLEHVAALPHDLAGLCGAVLQHGLDLVLLHVGEVAQHRVVADGGPAGGQA